MAEMHERIQVRRVVANIYSNFQKHSVGGDEPCKQGFNTPIDVGIGNKHFRARIAGNGDWEGDPGRQVNQASTPKYAFTDLSYKRSYEPMNATHFSNKSTVHFRFMFESSFEKSSLSATYRIGW